MENADCENTKEERAMRSKRGGIDQGHDEKFDRENDVLENKNRPQHSHRRTECCGKNDFIEVVGTNHRYCEA